MLIKAPFYVSKYKQFASDITYQAPNDPDFSKHYLEVIEPNTLFHVEGRLASVEWRGKDGRSFSIIDSLNAHWSIYIEKKNIVSENN